MTLFVWPSALDFFKISSATRDVAAMLCFRALPVLACALVTRRTSLPVKGGLLVVNAALGFFLHTAQLFSLEWLAFAYAFFFFGCALMPSISRLVRSGRLTRAGAFVTCAGVFYVMPIAIWPEHAKVTAFTLAWDLVLSSYSYCIEVSREDETPPFGDTLFFLLVNPVLVYGQRGERIGPPRFDARGAARSILGLAMAFVVSALLWPLYASLRQASTASAVSSAALLAACGASRFFVEYWLQAGVANLQIGLVRQLGYALPERFLLPIAATSIPDFWRRWNVYVSEWLLRYVYWPAAQALTRKTKRGWIRVAAIGLAVVLTFGGIGLLHDVHGYGGSFRLSTNLTQFFIFSGVLVLAWTALARLTNRLRGEGEWPAWLRLTGQLTSRAAIWCAVAFCFAKWWP